MKEFLTDISMAAGLYGLLWLLVMTPLLIAAYRRREVSEKLIRVYMGSILAVCTIVLLAQGLFR